MKFSSTAYTSDFLSPPAARAPGPITDQSISLKRRVRASLLDAMTKTGTHILESCEDADMAALVTGKAPTRDLSSIPERCLALIKLNLAWSMILATGQSRLSALEIYGYSTRDISPNGRIDNECFNVLATAATRAGVLAAGFAHDDEATTTRIWALWSAGDKLMAEMGPIAAKYIRALPDDLVSMSVTGERYPEGRPEELSELDGVVGRVLSTTNPSVVAQVASAMRHFQQGQPDEAKIWEKLVTQLQSASTCSQLDMDQADLELCALVIAGYLEKNGVLPPGEGMDHLPRDPSAIRLLPLTAFTRVRFHQFVPLEAMGPLDFLTDRSCALGPGEHGPYVVEFANGTRSSTRTILEEINLPDRQRYGSLSLKVGEVKYPGRLFSMEDPCTRDTLVAIERQAQSIAAICFPSCTTGMDTSKVADKCAVATAEGKYTASLDFSGWCHGWEVANTSTLAATLSSITGVPGFFEYPERCARQIKHGWAAPSGEIHILPADAIHGSHEGKNQTAQTMYTIAYIRVALRSIDRLDIEIMGSGDNISLLASDPFGQEVFDAISRVFAKVNISMKSEECVLFGKGKMFYYRQMYIDGKKVPVWTQHASQLSGVEDGGAPTPTSAARAYRAQLLSMAKYEPDRRSLLILSSAAAAAIGELLPDVETALTEEALAPLLDIPAVLGGCRPLCLLDLLVPTGTSSIPTLLDYGKRTNGAVSRYTKALLAMSEKLAVTMKTQTADVAISLKSDPTTDLTNPLKADKSMFLSSQEAGWAEEFGSALAKIARFSPKIAGDFRTIHPGLASIEHAKRVFRYPSLRKRGGPTLKLSLGERNKYLFDLMLLSSYLTGEISLPGTSLSVEILVTVTGAEIQTSDSVFFVAAPNDSVVVGKGVRMDVSSKGSDWSGDRISSRGEAGAATGQLIRLIRDIMAERPLTTGELHLAAIVLRLSPTPPSWTKGTVYSDASTVETPEEDEGWETRHFLSIPNTVTSARVPFTSISKIKSRYDPVVLPQVTTPAKGESLVWTASIVGGLGAAFTEVPGMVCTASPILYPPSARLAFEMLGLTYPRTLALWDYERLGFGAPMAKDIYGGKQALGSSPHTMRDETLLEGKVRSDARIVGSVLERHLRGHSRNDICHLLQLEQAKYDEILNAFDDDEYSTYFSVLVYPGSAASRYVKTKPKLVPHCYVSHTDLAYNAIGSNEFSQLPYGRNVLVISDTTDPSSHPSQQATSRNVLSLNRAARPMYLRELNVEHVICASDLSKETVERIKVALSEARPVVQVIVQGSRRIVPSTLKVTVAVHRSRVALDEQIIKNIIREIPSRFRTVLRLLKELKRLGHRDPVVEMVKVARDDPKAETQVGKQASPTAEDAKTDSEDDDSIEGRIKRLTALVDSMPPGAMRDSAAGRLEDLRNQVQLSPKDVKLRAYHTMLASASDPLVRSSIEARIRSLEEEEN